ncbi:Ig-like domain-containing protein [uncultured Desulfosarcina sp.]|uniref:Ig-like domain-containing protein n=1 Tax=uncultured Desulfosarcina sp. TaxID=218289 RepID=UPI0029C6D53C|nr:Ig-like domain-containing protein [uncultured Desulfosarcina sp.]
MRARLRFILAVAILGVAMAPAFFGFQSAQADDGSVTGEQYWGGENAPDWSANAYYTSQTWTFDSEPDWEEADLDNDGSNDAYVANGNGYAAEASSNAFGTPVFIRTRYDATAWDWVDEGPMDIDWVGVQGLIGGMGQGTFDFYIPVSTAIGTTEIWFQYVVYIPTGMDGSAAGITLATDSDFSATVGTQVGKSDEQISDLDGAGSIGDWFRVTETWQADADEVAGGALYLRITSSTGSFNLVDSVNAITRVVDNTPPTVSTTGPQDGATDVSVDAAIQIAFDKSMNTESVEQAFSLALASNPGTPVDGTYAWDALNAELTFTPDALLDSQTVYTVTVGITAADTSGNNLAQALSFSFSTSAYTAPVPKVDGTPEGTVDADTATLTIAGDGVYAYRYALDGADWSEACDPSEALSLTGLADGEHTLEIQVRDSLGNWADLDPITWIVMKPPTVTTAAPSAQAAISDSITVTFSESMDRQSAENAFSIVPSVDGSFSWTGDVTLVFTPAAVLDARTTYMVTIAATAADLAGNTLQEAYSWSFTTLAAKTVSCPASADTYILFGGMGGGGGYPKGTSTGEYQIKAGAVSIVDARALIRFDLSPMTDLGLSAEDIQSAYLVYAMVSGTTSMDVGPVASEGTAMYGFIYVLDTESREDTGETVSPFYWTEAVTGSGYVDKENKPWYVPGSPWVLAEHDTGPDTTGKIDIAPLVKGWLDGRWENNGIELKDQDDQSDEESEYGDGYSWHIASRENNAKAPYLLVTYDQSTLRITDRTASSQAMESQAQRTLTASGGASESYQWTVNGPDGQDLSASALSATTGAEVTFTAPDDPGLYTVILACGDDQDSINIGVGTAANASARAPLYLNASQSSRETALVNLCDNLLDGLGRCDSLGRIDLTDADGEILIGGTGLDSDARVSIAVINDPSSLTSSTVVTLEGFSGRNPSLEIFADSLTGITGEVYAVVVDTGRDAFGGASNVYLIELFDATGESITNGAINRLTLTLPFDPGVAAGLSFESGDSRVLYADTLEAFFSVDRQTVDPDGLVVDENLGTVTFETGHLSAYGLSLESGASASDFDTGESDSLGGGCFIGSLCPKARGNTK